jgi:uncharacterized protein (TIRG00374 family)
LSHSLRVWIGLAVALLAAAFALRDVDLGAVAAEFARARWGLLIGLSVPAYAAVVALRALRWRHLTDAIAPVPRAVMFRAVAVGFMANNLFPLRIGELVRVWFLAREARIPAAAVLGTVVLERALDGLCLIAIVLAVNPLLGSEAGVWGQALAWLAPVLLVPVIALAALRAAPERMLGLAAWMLRPVPARLGQAALRALRGFADGLGALRGGAHWFWVALHSLLIWLVASTLPFLAAFWALGLDLGGFARTLAAGWVMLAAIGVAVALPAAPGFFGLYHSACRLALERFGVPAETAVAIGTLCHAVFWVSLTGLGLLALRGRLAELRSAVPEPGA